MKILAVDWGWVRIGLAVSDDLGLTAQGLGTFPRVSEAQVLDVIATRVHALGVEVIVVGLPRNMDGTDGPSADAARAFAQALRDRFGLPVHLWDERLTTRAAERMLVDAGVRRRARRDRVDQVAATLILQGFLDRQRAAAEREVP
ncbi:MAG: Holliday junction resolvase RuvX [Zetaproteobacteria bacterium]|nr:MAG: Holliday junction resolvase RuvX [Zetaproteobacteria bacterium]